MATQTMTCNTYRSCEQFSYSVSPWCTQQSEPCKGRKVVFVRQVQCVDKNGVSVENKMCPMEAPAAEAMCNNEDAHNRLATARARENGCAKEEGARWTPAAKDPLDAMWDA